MVNNLIERLRSLESSAFECMCCELIRALGFKNVHLRGHHTDRDQGRDIEADFFRVLPGGHDQVCEKWFFECKHMQRNLSVDDIATKANWAEASGANFLVVLSISDLTTAARQYISDYQDHHRLVIKTWTGAIISELLIKTPAVLESYFPEIVDDPRSRSRIEAEHRITIARNLLTTIGVLEADPDPVLVDLIDAVFAKCLRKEDVAAIPMSSLPDAASEIIYLLSSKANKIVSDSEACKMLSSVINRHPLDAISWNAAKYLRSQEAPIAPASTKTFSFIGPVASGKSCLLAGLLYHLISEARFTFASNTMLQLAWMHRTIREAGMLHATMPSHAPEYTLYSASKTILSKKLSQIIIRDTAGEIFDREHGYWGKSIFESTAVFLIFDPTWGRSVLDESEGNKPQSFNGVFAAQKYQNWLRALVESHVKVFSVVTKTDLMTEAELNTHVLPSIRALSKEAPVIPTSVLQKTEMGILPNNCGLSTIVSHILKCL